MQTVILLGFCSFALAMLFTPVVRNLALRWNLVDVPDQSRKMHSKPIPRVGGIAVFLSGLAAFGLLILVSPKGGSLLREHSRLLLQLFPGTLLIFLTGLLDDLVGLKPFQKMLGQVSAAALTAFGGIGPGVFTGASVENLGGALLTIVWLVGCTNALNLIDGLDGLASGIGLFATLTTLLAAIVTGNVSLAIATVPLAGCLLGFLRYNFNPASVFLGDCGSLTIGFLLGCYSVVWGMKSATVLGMAAPVIALAVPLTDVGVSIFRRYLRRQSIFSADRGHIHHRLLDRGLTPRAVALTLYAVSFTAAVVSLLQSVLRQEMAALAVLLFCAAAVMAVRHLKYPEFEVLGKMVSGGTFRRVMQEQILLHNFRRSLAGASTLEEHWHAVSACCRELGFPYAALRAPHCVFHSASAATDIEHLWRIRVSLTDSICLDVGGQPDGFAASHVLGSLIQILSASLESQLPPAESRRTTAGSRSHEKGGRLDTLPPKSATAG